MGPRFRFVEGDIREPRRLPGAPAPASTTCCTRPRWVQQPRSLADPIATNAANITGFLNMLVAARDAGVARFVYAASSSTYGDHPGLPKVEVSTRRCRPTAVTNIVNELYADVFARTYGFNTIGLRYFNVFGARQDPEGAYAAVIPKWAAALLAGETVFINGDGETSRDFCYVANAVQANLLAATTPGRRGRATRSTTSPSAIGRPQLAVRLLRDGLAEQGVSGDARPVYRDFRAGDVRHSQADISKITRLLGYVPSHALRDGIRQALPCT